MAAGIIGSVIIAILGYLAQIAIFPALGAHAVAPNMILAVSVVLGMIFGPLPALAMGFLGGLMVDFMAGGAIGLSALIPMITGFLIGALRRELNSTHFAWAIIFSAAAHIVNDIWQVMTMYFARIDIYISFGTLLRSIISAVESGAFAGIIFLIISRLLFMGEKRSGLPYLQRY